MEDYARLLNRFLCRDISVHIYSFPHFTIESFVAVLICIVFVLLHFEITNISIMTLKLKPNTISMCRNGSNSYVEDSCTSTTISRFTQEHRYNRRNSAQLSFKKVTKTVSNNSQLGWMVSHNGDSPYGSFLNEPEHVHSVYNLTPKEYVKREKERKKHENELKYCLKSLSSLYDEVINKKLPAEKIAHHIAQAKENLQTAKLTNETAKYLSSNTDAMTKSLFDLLERIILSSSIENPIPFKGNITTLVCDAGDLETKDSDLESHFNNQDKTIVKYKTDRDSTTTTTLSDVSA